jgi:hypothetical protein
MSAITWSDYMTPSSSSTSSMSSTSGVWEGAAPPAGYSGGWKRGLTTSTLSPLATVLARRDTPNSRLTDPKLRIKRNDGVDGTAPDLIERMGNLTSHYYDNPHIDGDAPLKRRIAPLMPRSFPPAGYPLPQQKRSLNASLRERNAPPPITTTCTTTLTAPTCTTGYVETPTVSVSSSASSAASSSYSDDTSMAGVSTSTLEPYTGASGQSVPSDTASYTSSASETQPWEGAAPPAGYSGGWKRRVGRAGMVF